MRALLFALSLPLLMPGTAGAERSQDFGDFVVHFNAFSTTLLSPDVTSAYDIQRSPYQGLLNVAVQKKVMQTTGEPVVADVSGTITNLMGQTQAVKPREIRESTAIYYIQSFRITNEETLDFDLQVRPQGAAEPLSVRFKQQFFVD